MSTPQFSQSHARRYDEKTMEPLRKQQEVLYEEEEFSPLLEDLVRRPAYPADARPKLGEIMRCKTVYQCFERALRMWPDAPYLGWRSYESNGTRGPYRWKTYTDVSKLIVDVGIGLNAVTGLMPGEHICLWLPNCPEWVILEQTCNRYGFVSVPLFDALSVEQTEYVLDHCDARVLVTHPRTTKQALAALPKCPLIRYVIEIDAEFNEAMEAGWKLEEPEIVGRQQKARAHSDTGIFKPYYTISSGNLTLRDYEAAAAKSQDCIVCECCGAARHRTEPPILMRFSEIEEAGRAAAEHQWRVSPPPYPNEESCASIVYTSGTTGTPKGVMILQKAIMACITGWYEAGVYLYPGDTHLSILPLAHVYERSVSHAVVCFGGRLGFPSNGVHNLLSDVAEVKPSFLIGVPRLFEKIVQGVLQKIDQLPPFKRHLFWTVFNAKLHLGSPGKRFLGPLDDLVFGDIRRALGGRCRFIISGSAPLPQAVYNFFFIAFGLQAVLQGYGLTETSAAGMVTDFQNPVPSVGSLSSVLELRLVSVPNTVYNPLLGTGELLIRGPAVTPMYYRNPEASRAALSVDGWLATGDVARLNLDGSVSVIDRRKNLLKLGQGEYISVERLEAILGGCSYVDNIMIYGSGYESQLLAVIVPNYRALQQLVETGQPRFMSTTAFKGLFNCPQEEGGFNCTPAEILRREIDASRSQSEIDAESRMTKDEAEAADLRVFCSSREIARVLCAELAAYGRMQGLRGFELPAALVLEPKSFAVETGELTPTQKLRRQELTRRYMRRFTALYSQLRSPNTKAEDFSSDVTGWVSSMRSQIASGLQRWTHAHPAALQ